MFKRITKRQAKQLFADGKLIYLCPAKLRPGFPFNNACPVTMTDDLKHSALRYRDYAINQDIDNYSKQYAHLWKGDIVSTAWDLMYNNWSYYNTSYETGYYAHYYVEVNHG